MPDAKAPPAGYVLVADDDPLLRELVATLLADEGYEVGVAETVAGALDLARARQPAVILFGLLLPDGDGAVFVRAYRGLPGAAAALIAVSGLASLERIAADLGVFGYLGKPFDIDQLLDRVAEGFAWASGA